MRSKHDAYEACGEVGEGGRELKEAGKKGTEVKGIWKQDGRRKRQRCATGSMMEGRHARRPRNCREAMEATNHTLEGRRKQRFTLRKKHVSFALGLLKSQGVAQCRP